MLPAQAEHQRASGKLDEEVVLLKDQLDRGVQRQAEAVRDAHVAAELSQQRLVERVNEVQ